MMRLVINEVKEENIVFQWIAKKPKEKRCRKKLMISKMQSKMKATKRKNPKNNQREQRKKTLEIALSEVESRD